MPRLVGTLATVIAAVALLLGSTTRAEIVKDPSLCARTRCVVRPEAKFKYAVGTYYRYRHSVEVSTNLGKSTGDDSERSGSSGERNGSGDGEESESRLFVDSTVTLRFASACEGYLRITNSSVRHDRESYSVEFPDRADAEFKSRLERYELRFAFDDGRINEVCPDAAESAWSLNFKRGVLSMLQNTMKRFDVDRRGPELDVNGICETRYRLREAKKTSLVVRKTKDLGTCVHGGKHLSIVRSNFYRSPRTASARPLLDSRGECDVTIDRNVYETVVCRESHRLRAFANGPTAGAETLSVATLRLFDESLYDIELDGVDAWAETAENPEESGPPRNLVNAKRTDLLYDHSALPRTVHGDLRTSRVLLMSLCDLGATEELQRRFSEVYTEFVRTSRLLDYPSLSQLLARADEICAGGRKHVTNALAFIGSNAAVRVMRDLITSRAVGKETTGAWVTAFALIPRPDAGTLEALAPLLESPDPRVREAQFVLSYSAVVHAFCSSRDAKCADPSAPEPIDRFIRRLESIVEEGCAPKYHDLPSVKKTLEAIKAIGNAGLETETLSKRLKTCIDDTGGFLPMEIRVSAIEAHRRLPSCPETRDSIFLDYYRNVTHDPEIRIASYLQVMRCPDYSVVKIIKRALKREEVNQVGSFVWSHLTNLLASSSPTRVEIQSLLTDRDLGGKFNSDARKYSRNYEGSFFSEEWNFGANYQSNVVFSSKSYVPRSINLNVTVDLFGESVNALEVSVRTEGAEYYAEKIFGPDGPLGNERVSETFGKFLRAFRSAGRERNDYRAGVESLPNVIDNNFDDPRISASYKIFGNELRFAILNGDREIREGLATFDPWSKLRRILSGREFHRENTVVFLDSSYVVPTTSGLPVRLDLTGSAAYNFKFSGLLDTERFAANNEIVVAGHLTPSFSLDVTGRMVVDAFYKSAGLKLRGNVYSFGAVQLNLKIEGARLVRLSLDLPKRSMELISVRSDVLLLSTNGAETTERRVGESLTGEKSGKALVSENVIRDTACAWSAVERLVGLKLCADYQFPNVTRIPGATSLVLNGPTLFKVYLIKSDPTARSYLLEYKRNVTPEQSTVKLAFDTPGSALNREFSATVSFDPKNHNVTLLLHSSGNSLVAKGTYKRTDSEAMIDVGLDINGTKHLDASLGYTRKRDNYGFEYAPKLYLAINGETIAELAGTVRNARKNNVSQCDIKLTFATKKIKSRLLGYVIRRNTSLTGNAKLDYQLSGSPKKETLQVEVSLTNRSSRTLTRKEAELKVHSTAYPRLNAVVSTWYQQALGHVEIHAEINDKPHLRDKRHALTARLVLTHSQAYFQSQEAKINAYVAVTKPVQNLDLKIGVQRFAVGAASDTNLLVRYAPGKTISFAVRTICPRGAMFAIEAHANLTIPNLNSMLVDARINERARREYEIELSGTWFSGHNATLRGTYVDRSTTAIVNHGLKLALVSPSFQREILVYCKLYDDALDLKIGLYLEHLDSEKYALVVEHSTLSPTKLLTYAEGRYRNKVYTMTTNVDTEREIRTELHLDRWRDVHLIGTAINRFDSKKFGLEVKWDANRNPSLKFATTVQLDGRFDEATNAQNYTATVVVGYPSRLFTGSCLFARRAPNNYVMDARIDWDVEKTIRLSVDTDRATTGQPDYLKFESRLVTPFQNWKKTSLNARYWKKTNELGASCSAFWQDKESATLEVRGATRRTNESVEYSGIFDATSTVHAIGWTKANFTHKRIGDRSIETRLRVDYEPERLIDVKSLWFVDRDENGNCNVTGKLQLLSPIANYRKGEMKCQLRFMPNWRFYGASNLELDKKMYTGILVGDLARIKESIVEFNVTTPLERYAFLRGRFGLSERERRVVARVVGPTGPIGFEALCRLFAGSTYDFHVKLSIATPVDLLQRSLLVAKLNRREADFRLAYNNITVGFQGVWRFNNLTDFHYSYVLFTPIHGLRESGVVAKLVAARVEPDRRLDVDTEFSVRVVETKIGLRAHGGPKPPPPDILGRGVAPADDPPVDADETYEDEDDDEDTLYWKGDFEINAAVIAPIIGTIDLDKEGSIHKAVGSMTLPQGTVRLDDRFVFRDVFTIRNELSIETPFEVASEINSLCVFNVDSENSIYLMEMSLNYGNASSNWTEMGLFGNYSYAEGEQDDSQTHTLGLKFKTPLAFLRWVETTTVYEVDENVYRSGLSIRSERARAELAGNIEIDENFLDAAFTAEVDSPAVSVPRTRISAKKDFTDREKHVELSVALAKDKTAEFSAYWLTENSRYGRARFSLDSWIKPLRSIEADALWANDLSRNDSARLEINFKHYPEQEYQFRGNLLGGDLRADVRTPLNDYERLEYRGSVEAVNDLVYLVRGELKNPASPDVWGVTGNLTVHDSSDQFLLRVELKRLDDRRSVVVVLLRDENSLVLRAESPPAVIGAQLDYTNPLNWNSNLDVEIRDREGSQLRVYKVDTFMVVRADGNTTFRVNAATPWQELRTFGLDGNVLLDDTTGDARVDNRLNDRLSYARASWKLVYLVDMWATVAAGTNEKNVEATVFLNNPKKAFRNVAAGFDVNVDREAWRFAGKATVGVVDRKKYDAVVVVRLPPPDNDHHRFLITYRNDQGLRDTSYVLGYNALAANTNYASDGSIKMGANALDGHVRFVWGNVPIRTINNVLNVTFDQKSLDVECAVFTPQYRDEETAVLRMSYNATPESHSLLNADLYSPSKRKIGTARISYASLSNVNGTLNATTPVPQFPYAGCNFIVLTTLKQNKRFFEVFWPNETALLNSDYAYQSQRLDSSLAGVLRLEVPLSTRHAADVTYGYKKRPQVMTGHAELTYNEEKMVDARYDSKGESRAGFDKDSIEITLDNPYTPLAIIYTNQYEYSGGNEGTNYPTVDHKRVNVYRLDNSSAFNVIGESRIRTTHEGQEIRLKGVHFDRTIQLRTDYQVLPGEFDQYAWISLAENAWASYRVSVVNKTTDRADDQCLVLNVAYPRRNLTLDASYRVTARDLDSEARLTWDEKSRRPRTVGASFQWKNSTDERRVRQQAVLSFHHPSFAKNVTFSGKLARRDPRDLLNATLVVDYSNDPEKLLALSAVIRDASETPADTKYAYSVRGSHPKTRLDLRVDGNFRKRSNVLLETDHRGSYARTGVPRETGIFRARLDADDYAVLFHRESNDLVKRLDLRYYPTAPDYVLNGSIVDTPDLNATGALRFNYPEKLVRMMLNYTPDAVESLRMYGNIPDARNAIFDIWRTYDQDLVVSDVAFYLKLNHSRLVTSKLKWRPELREDISNHVTSAVTGMYEDVGKDIDYWKRYVKTETVSAINDVWRDARDDIRVFLDDWDDLRVLEKDAEDLKVYLNRSYNSNDFYIKDIVAMGVYAIDELSLHTHIKTLPNIINEIWEIMGESGEAIRNSLVWIIETVKTAYKRFSEIVTAVLHGESVARIAHIVEKLIVRYDMFVKDLHVSFIKYISNLWKKVSTGVSQQWHALLKTIEPVAIRVLHYLEAVVWKVSKEVVDFLYDRQNEIIGSPYFDRFTNLTHDVDRIYRDIRANDIVTNVQKYSAIFVKFIRERYFTIVPFGKELKELVDEILTELKELAKLPTVNYAIVRINRVYERAKYFYEYFGVRAKVENLLRIAHAKFIDMSQTALQAESRYREAKTKFIFDPNEGLMCLEQKLPMSWHAFNQTPEFQEIPEYRAIADLQTYFTTSNTTFWTLYYRYKPYTEPANWLPPFKAQAMIVGSQHLVTFDGRHYDFSGSCTYLLARDFVNNHFAVLISYDRRPNEKRTVLAHRIIVLIGETVIELDVFRDTVRLIEDSGAILQLPVELENGTAFVYQEESIVTVETKHERFKLRCNLKYDLCVLELSGYYFGKTAGLLGTMNNEEMDDALTSAGNLERDVGLFAGSWSLTEECANPAENSAVKIRRPENVDYCENLFVNKSSEFAGCFNVIDPNDYARVCFEAPSEEDICTIALSYMQKCGFYDTYLRIPDKCTTCRMVDGSIVSEGEFRKLDGGRVPLSTDVVFIVEAKECNRDLRQNRSIDQLVSQMSKELAERGLLDNRWSLVVFGGDGAYDRPRNLIHQNRAFTDHPAEFARYFGKLPIGDGNRDLFAAIGFASQLVFRAGVSKTFVLVPCSHCEPQNQSLDYSVLHQVLLEHDVTLHVLMDGDFHFAKQRVGKMFYGLDAHKSYTRKDAKNLVGDVDLRRQVKLSKTALGYCAPLSLETNGTIFSGDKLRFEKSTSVKKFTTVFAKRVAQSANPSPCQHCECTANNDGTTRMECTPCVYPMPVSVDYVTETFNEDDTLAILQPIDLDYGQLDGDD